MLESGESWRAGNPGEEGNPVKKEAREGKEARRGKKGKKIEPRAPPAGQTDEKRADFSGTAKLRPPYHTGISVPEPAPPARASRALRARSSPNKGLAARFLRNKFHIVRAFFGK